MPYVQRNENSEIVGLYALPQPQPDGSVLTEPDPLPEDHPDVVAFREPPVDLTAHAANVRWQLEVGGTTWNNWPVHTDRESQGKIMAERLAIAEGERDDPSGWKFADGEFRVVSNDDFKALASHVRAHVQTAFGAEAMVLAQIVDGTLTTEAEVEQALKGAYASLTDS